VPVMRGWQGSSEARVFLCLCLPIPRSRSNRVVHRLANGGPTTNSMRADLDTPERLGVNAGLRGSLTSSRFDSHHAFVPALL